MRVGLMRPAAGEVLHFSEDPTIEVFRPHVAATARQPDAYVWAVGAERCPDYWFPRQCPRAMAWMTDESTEDDREALLDGALRLHLVEESWLPAMREVALFAYRFDAADFTVFGAESHAVVSDHEVRPLGAPEPVGDLIAAHEAAGIELRPVMSLWPWWDEVVTSSLGFSGIRLRNAAPRA